MWKRLGHSWWMYLALMGTVLFLTSCEQKSINQILADPQRYANHEVGVVGKVVKSYSVMGNGFYQIDDGTGQLWVVSHTGVPREGARVCGRCSGPPADGRRGTPARGGLVLFSASASRAAGGARPRRGRGRRDVRRARATPRVAGGARGDGDRPRRSGLRAGARRRLFFGGCGGPIDADPADAQLLRKYSDLVDAMDAVDEHDPGNPRGIRGRHPVEGLVPVMGVEVRILSRAPL